MSAAERAEARRKAILSRGGDRLAKLTSSARGEGAVHLHNDPVPNISQGMRNFVGEETSMPPPPNRGSPSPSSQPSYQSTAPLDPSVWSQEQQMQLLQAMMGQPPPVMPPSNGQDATSGPDHFSAMLASAVEQQKKSGSASTSAQKPQTRLQKLMPIIHLGSIWCLLAYFVLYKEPQIYDEGVHTMEYSRSDVWGRWADFGRTTHVSGVWRLALVPFFWAFTTLEIVLHSMRIFSGFDVVQPPTLLSLVLPQLPPHFGSYIMNGLKYLQMGSLFLDDLAGLLVGIGFIILFSSWITST